MKGNTNSPHKRRDQGVVQDRKAIWRQIQKLGYSSDKKFCEEAEIEHEDFNEFCKGKHVPSVVGALDKYGIRYYKTQKDRVTFHFEISPSPSLQRGENGVAASTVIKRDSIRVTSKERSYIDHIMGSEV